MASRKKKKGSGLRIALMRELDSLLGPVVCCLLIIVRIPRRLIRWIFKRSIDTRALVPSSILVMKFFGMGSILLSTPTLRFLKKQFPGAKISFLTFKSNGEICRNIEYIDDVITIDNRSMTSFIVETLKMLQCVRRSYFDLIVDLEFFSNFGTFLIALIPHSQAIGFYTYRFWRRPFYDYSVSYDSTRHMTELYLKLSKIWSLDKQDSSLYRIQVKEQYFHELEKKIAEFGLSGEKKLVVLNLNAGALSFHRRWPPENFIELAARLAELDDYQFVVIGSKDEKEYAKDFIDKWPHKNNMTDLSGELSLMQLTALLQKSFLYIGNDSGPTHLAASAGVPIICFFGPETPYLYGPVNTTRVILYNEIFCSPCISAFTFKRVFCRDNTCMKSITVSQAWESTRKFIETLERKNAENNTQ